MKMKTAKNFEEMLDVKYGKIGTPKRNKHELQAEKFVLSEILKLTRKEAKITQEELADKIGTKKSYISRLENGDCDINISTLFKIFESGLAIQVVISII